MRIGIVCYPTFGGSGVLATELGKALAQKGHQVHFILTSSRYRLNGFIPKYFITKYRFLLIRCLIIRHMKQHWQAQWWM